MEQSAVLEKNNINSLSNRRHSMRAAYHRQDSYEDHNSNSIQHRKRLTWYTPTRGAYSLSKVPSDLYDPDKIEINTIASFAINNQRNPVFDLGKVDVYDRVRINDRQWHNMLAKCASERPY